MYNFFFFFFENTMFQRTMDDSLSAKQVLRPVEKASGRIQLPHEILVDLLKVDCTVSCYVIATKGY